MEGLMLHAGAQKIGRQELLTLPVPEATDTHKPIAHSTFVENILQALAYRKIGITKDEYGITPDGMRMFGFIQTDIEQNGVALGIGLRNGNDRSVSLGLVAGFRTCVCDNTSFVGEFQVIAKKHTKRLNIEDAVAMGIDRVQRRFQPMLDRIDAWQNHSLPDIQAREIIYRAFIADELAAPKALAKVVHKNYFEPELEEFKPRTVFSLHSAFTSAQDPGSDSRIQGNHRLRKILRNSRRLGQNPKVLYQGVFFMPFKMFNLRSGRPNHVFLDFTQPYL